MPTVKQENYTPEQTQEMVSRYTACGTGVTKSDHEKRAEVVKQLASEFGKTPRSIRSKLVTQKVYIKVAPESKVTGEKPEKKEVMAQNVADAFGVEVIDGKEHRLLASSLEKMNKTELAILFHRFNSEVVEDADDSEPADVNENDSQVDESE